MEQIITEKELNLKTRIKLIVIPFVLAILLSMHNRYDFMSYFSFLGLIALAVVMVGFLILHLKEGYYVINPSGIFRYNRNHEMIESYPWSPGCVKSCRYYCNEKMHLKLLEIQYVNGTILKVNWNMRFVNAVSQYINVTKCIQDEKNDKEFKVHFTMIVLSFCAILFAILLLAIYT